MSTAQSRDALREALVAHYLTAWNNTDLMAAARADSLLSGPLSQILSDLTEARALAQRAGEERDRARDLNRDLHRRVQKSESFRARHRSSFNYVINARRKDRLACRKAEAERDRAVAEAEKRGAALMRHAAVTACLDLNDAYRETSEHQIAQRNTAKAAEAIAWADGTMLCAHAIRDLPFDLRAARSVIEPTEGEDAR
jgi:hypothetical protein